MSVDALCAEDAALEQRCGEAFSLVRQYEAARNQQQPVVSWVWALVGALSWVWALVGALLHGAGVMLSWVLVVLPLGTRAAPRDRQQCHAHECGSAVCRGRGVGQPCVEALSHIRQYEVARKQQQPVVGSGGVIMAGGSVLLSWVCVLCASRHMRGTSWPPAASSA